MLVGAGKFAFHRLCAFHVPEHVLVELRAVPAWGYQAWESCMAAKSAVVAGFMSPHRPEIELLPRQKTVC